VHLDLIGVGLAAVADVTGDPTMAVPGRLQLTGYRPVSAAAARTWTSTADHVTRQLADDDAAASPLVLGSAARLLAAGVLATFPNNAASGPHREKSGDAHPQTVQRAVTFIDAHAAQDIAIVDIAAAAFVTARAVQLAFRRHLDTTPLAYLRRIRLERAHADLLAADPARTTVTAVAYRWGFPSPSRFTADYRQTYGITPSRTLHRG
jgi:AraC-like DNA-binding protein